ncbi:hypothetical protein ACFQBQ_00920 [Granulicella cerasi]|uniref:Uncharacterized protein n=1 Tax=Granulicella cerasi TaxID=741063 RepID=A0ABW1Z599_9BACT|nr:hypothetical protein [Granulicella cerasi]
MRRRDFIAAAGGGLLASVNPPSIGAFVNAVAGPARGLLFGVDARVSAKLATALASLQEAAPTHPLLRAMGATGKVPVSDTRKLLASPKDLAYNHLLLIGRPDDPLIVAAWQREAEFSAKGAYIYGFGGFSGDVGYVESDRSPFLHSLVVPSAPYETEVITITGTTDEGIALALRAFLDRGLVNGVVAANGWKRTETTLLDRDPLPPKFELPVELAPETLEGYTRVAYVQASEDEYRGVLEDTSLEPLQMARFKYYRAGAWDGKGAAAAFDNYSFGLHRRAYGNTLWLARFASESDASAAAPKIAATAKLTRSGERWTGVQPAYGFAPPGQQSAPAGPLQLWQQKEWVLMSTLDSTKGSAS